MQTFEQCHIKFLSNSLNKGLMSEKNSNSKVKYLLVAGALLMAVALVINPVVNGDDGTSENNAAWGQLDNGAAIICEQTDDVDCATTAQLTLFFALAFAVIAAVLVNVSAFGNYVKIGNYFGIVAGLIGIWTWFDVYRLVTTFDEWYNNATGSDSDIIAVGLGAWLVLGAGMLSLVAGILGIKNMKNP